MRTRGERRVSGLRHKHSAGSRPADRAIIVWLTLGPFRCCRTSKQADQDACGSRGDQGVLACGLRRLGRRAAALADLPRLVKRSGPCRHTPHASGQHGGKRIVERHHDMQAMAWPLLT